LGCFAFILAFIPLFSLGIGGSWTGHLIPVKTCGKQAGMKEKIGSGHAKQQTKKHSICLRKN
jgi:hypothetical protein